MTQKSHPRKLDYPANITFACPLNTGSFLHIPTQGINPLVLTSKWMSFGAFLFSQQGLRYWWHCSHVQISQKTWMGARGGTVGWGTALQARRSWVRLLMVSLGIFRWQNPSSRTTTLGLTQPLIEMSARKISREVKGGQCVGLTTLLPSFADCLEIWEPQPLETLRAYPGL